MWGFVWFGKVFAGSCWVLWLIRGEAWATSWGICEKECRNWTYRCRWACSCTSRTAWLTPRLSAWSWLGSTCYQTSPNQKSFQSTSTKNSTPKSPSSNWSPQDSLSIHEKNWAAVIGWLSKEQEEQPQPVTHSSGYGNGIDQHYEVFSRLWSCRWCSKTSWRFVMVIRCHRPIKVAKIAIRKGCDGLDVFECSL